MLCVRVLAPVHNLYCWCAGENYEAAGVAIGDRLWSARGAGGAKHCGLLARHVSEAAPVPRTAARRLGWRRSRAGKFDPHTLSLFSSSSLRNISTVIHFICFRHGYALAPFVVSCTVIDRRRR